MRIAEKTNAEWVADTVERVPEENMPKYSCVERRCEPLPAHAHRHRPYLIHSKRPTDPRP